MRHAQVVLFVMVCALPAMAQQSTNFKVESAVFNAAGHPAEGMTLSSASFRVTLDAIGDAVAGPALSSGSFVAHAGLVAIYPPPGEVDGLIFVDATTLQWNAERSAGSYNLYRASISGLAGLQYGACLQTGLATPGATDTDPVPSADGFFYLVTVANRLDEQGSKGFHSDSSERPGTVCP